ncbi:hypothetical protein S40288_11675 [Stachybotrys chartarum IBT 40288]|nr:hypothetical protein S40288_11675 [Stachybotrys chartarum IBT 40288]
MRDSVLERRPAMDAWGQESPPGPAGRETVWQRGPTWSRERNDEMRNMLDKSLYLMTSKEEKATALDLERVLLAIKQTLEWTWEMSCFAPLTAGEVMETLGDVSCPLWRGTVERTSWRRLVAEATKNCHSLMNRDPKTGVTTLMWKHALLQRIVCILRTEEENATIDKDKLDAWRVLVTDSASCFYVLARAAVQFAIIHGAPNPFREGKCKPFEDAESKFDGSFSPQANPIQIPALGSENRQRRANDPPRQPTPSKKVLWYIPQILERISRSLRPLIEDLAHDFSVTGT